MNESVEATLKQRGQTHGDFADNASASQAIKNTIKTHTQFELTDVQKEALENIAQKIARIITGNPAHADSWHDIGGYARLAEKEALE